MPSLKRKSPTRSSKPSTKKAAQSRKKAATRKAATKKAATKKAATKKAARSGASSVARVESLTKVFATLGAKSPERWARTQIENGTDELGRFVLLRALWFRAVEPGRLLANARKEKGVADVIDRVMQKLDLAELDALVRFAQRSALDDVCKVLDDPADNDDGIRWTVFRVDPSGMPLWPLSQLRKDLGETEP